MNALALLRAGVSPGREADLFVVDGRLSAQRPPGDVREVDLAGQPTLVGLADQHLHLLGLAAAWSSIDCSPVATEAGGDLAAVLKAARRRQPTGVLRGVGYDVAANGEVDRLTLDQAGAGSVRLQDSTGILWILDSFTLNAVLPADPRDWPAGVQRDAAGVPTGQLYRLDTWLRSRLPATAPPDLQVVGQYLASRGVTAVTDASADNDSSHLEVLAGARLPQRVTAMTAAPEVSAPAGVHLGPVKVLLDDHDLPPLYSLAARVAAAHAHGRTVAVHCVTEVQLLLALSAGLRAGDRIEHASYVPTEMLGLLAASGVTVVVHPELVRARGDRYLEDFVPAEHDALHRARSFITAGLPVAAGSDAPYGNVDPWPAIAAAVNRRTAGGRQLGPGEAVDVGTALSLYQGRSDAPGVPRSLTAGQPADLMILESAWPDLAESPTILATIVAGRVVYGSIGTD